MELNSIPQDELEELDNMIITLNNDILKL
jgi:hypothetical protein